MDFSHLEDTKFPNLETASPYALKNTFDYTRWVPGTKIKLCNVLWNSDYDNVVKFSDDDTRDKWFDTIDGNEIELTSNARMVPDGTIKLPLPYDVLTQYNYIRIEIPLATGKDKLIQDETANGVRKWHFFLVDIEYSAPNTSIARLQLDVWTQFIDTVTIKYMMLERGHAPVSVTDTDTYLSNPIENNKYLLAPDVNYDDSSVVRDSKYVPFGSGDKYVCIATTATYSQIDSGFGVTKSGSGTFTEPTFSDTSDWFGYQLQVNGFDFGNDIDYSDLKTPTKPQSGNNYMVPNGLSIIAVSSTDTSFLSDVHSQVPTFLRTIKGVFIVDESMVTLGASHSIAGHTVHECSGTSGILDGYDLSKGMFGFDSDEQRFAKLYTYPYSRLEVSDNSGKTVEVRIENTGKIGMRMLTSVAFPVLDFRVYLTGINGEGSQSYTWKNLDGESLSLEVPNGDWDKLKFEFDIPTFALYMDAETSWMLDNYNTVIVNGRRKALTQYHNSARSANASYTTNVQTTENTYTTTNNTIDNTYATAEASIANTYTNAMLKAQNTRTVTKNTIATDYQNTTVSAEVAQTNANATADTNRDNAYASAETARDNTKRSAAADYNNSRDTGQTDRYNTRNLANRERDNTKNSASTAYTNAVQEARAVRRNSKLMATTIRSNNYELADAGYKNARSQISASTANGNEARAAADRIVDRRNTMNTLNQTDYHAMNISTTETNNQVTTSSAQNNAIASVATGIISGAAGGATMAAAGGPGAAAIGGAAMGVIGGVTAGINAYASTQNATLITQAASDVVSTVNSKEGTILTRAKDYAQLITDRENDARLNDGASAGSESAITSQTGQIGNNNIAMLTQAKQNRSTTKSNADDMRDRQHDNAERTAKVILGGSDGYSSDPLSFGDGSAKRTKDTVDSNANDIATVRRQNALRTYRTIVGGETPSSGDEPTSMYGTAKRTKETVDTNADNTYTVTRSNADNLRVLGRNNAQRTYNATVQNAGRTRDTGNDNADANFTTTTGVALNNRTTDDSNANLDKTTAQNNATLNRTTALDNATKTRQVAILNAQETLTTYQDTVKAAYYDARRGEPVQLASASGDAENMRFGQNGIQFRLRTQSDSAIAQTAAQFARYGYTLNQLWDVGTTGLNLMKNFTYWKAKDIWVDVRSAADSGIGDAISNMFKRGVTVWSEPDTIGKVGIYDN